MPILKRRYRRRSPLGFLQLLWLVDGIQIADAFDAADTDTIRDAWRGIEVDVVPAWIQEVPGSRPWGWWQFSAPRPPRENEGELVYLENTGLLTDDERRALDAIPEERRPFLSFDLRRWWNNRNREGS